MGHQCEIRCVWSCSPSYNSNLLRYLLPCVIVMVSVRALEHCMSGTHMSRHGSGNDICVRCVKGKTFMPERSHNNSKCFDCSKIKNPFVEVINTECDLENDTVIHCIDGYYRKRARNSRDVDVCVRCSDCDHVTLPCKNYHDVVCCPPNYDAVQITDNVFHCREPPIKCLPGQYFSKIREQCLPCPYGTYMPDSNHNHTSCLKCRHRSNNSTLNSNILQNCSNTSPTLFGCPQGYFRSYYESLLTEVDCTKCKKCPGTVHTHCSLFQNTICEQPNNKKNLSGNESCMRNTMCPEPYCCEGGNCTSVSSCQNSTMRKSQAQSLDTSSNIVIVIPILVFVIIIIIIIIIITIFNRRKKKKGISLKPHDNLQIKCDTLL